MPVLLPKLYTRLPTAALKVRPLPGAASKYKFFTAASLESNASSNKFLQNRRNLDTVPWSNLCQESGRLRSDCGGWMKNREKEMLTDKEKRKKMCKGKKEEKEKKGKEFLPCLYLLPCLPCRQ